MDNLIKKIKALFFKSSADCLKTVEKAVLGGTDIPRWVSMPVIHEREGVHYLAYFIRLKSNITKSEDIDRPMVWAIANIKTGELIRDYICSQVDFSAEEIGKKYKKEDLEEMSQEHCIEALLILDKVRKSIINQKNLDLIRYKEYLDRITKNIANYDKLFYLELSI